jgi:hypothetical protein
LRARHESLAHAASDGYSLGFGRLLQASIRICWYLATNSMPWSGALREKHGSICGSHECLTRIPILRADRNADARPDGYVGPIGKTERLL